MQSEVKQSEEVCFRRFAVKPVEKGTAFGCVSEESATKYT